MRRRLIPAFLLLSGLLVQALPQPRVQNEVTEELEEVAPAREGKKTDGDQGPTLEIKAGGKGKRGDGGGAFINLDFGDGSREVDAADGNAAAGRTEYDYQNVDSDASNSSQEFDEDDDDDDDDDNADSVDDEENEEDEERKMQQQLSAAEVFRGTTSTVTNLPKDAPRHIIFRPTTPLMRKLIASHTTRPSSGLPTTATMTTTTTTTTATSKAASTTTHRSTTSTRSSNQQQTTTAARRAPPSKRPQLFDEVQAQDFDVDNSITTTSAPWGAANPLNRHRRRPKLVRKSASARVLNGDGDFMISGHRLTRAYGLSNHAVQTIQRLSHDRMVNGRMNTANIELPAPKSILPIFEVPSAKLSAIKIENPLAHRKKQADKLQRRARVKHNLFLPTSTTTTTTTTTRQSPTTTKRRFTSSTTTTRKPNFSTAFSRTARSQSTLTKSRTGDTPVLVLASGQRDGKPTDAKKIFADKQFDSLPQRVSKADSVVELGLNRRATNISTPAAMRQRELEQLGDAIEAAIVQSVKGGPSALEEGGRLRNESPVAAATMEPLDPHLYTVINGVIYKRHNRLDSDGTAKAPNIKAMDQEILDKDVAVPPLDEPSEEVAARCYRNINGFSCCSSLLEHQLRRTATSISRLGGVRAIGGASGVALRIQQDAERRFGTPFEVAVSGPGGELAVRWRRVDPLSCAIRLRDGYTAAVQAIGPPKNQQQVVASSPPPVASNRNNRWWHAAAFSANAFRAVDSDLTYDEVKEIEEMPHVKHGDDDDDDAHELEHPEHQEHDRRRMQPTRNLSSVRSAAAFSLPFLLVDEPRMPPSEVAVRRTRMPVIVVTTPPSIVITPPPPPQHYILPTALSNSLIDDASNFEDITAEEVGLSPPEAVADRLPSKWSVAEAHPNDIVFDRNDDDDGDSDGVPVVVKQAIDPTKASPLHSVPLHERSRDDAMILAQAPSARII